MMPTRGDANDEVKHAIESSREWQLAQRAAFEVQREYDRRIKKFIERHEGEWEPSSKTAQQFDRLLMQKLGEIRNTYHAHGFIVADQVPRDLNSLYEFIQQCLVTLEMVEYADTHPDSLNLGRQYYDKVCDYADGLLKDNPKLQPGPSGTGSFLSDLRGLRAWCLAAMRSSLKQKSKSWDETSLTEGKEEYLPKPPKQPSQDAFTAFNLYATGDYNQQQVADTIIKKQHRLCSQGQVSRWIRQVNRWNKAFGFPVVNTRKKKAPNAVDPQVIELGKRTDGKSKISRPQKSDE